VERVETWAQDEARLGLQPVLRRVWAPRGKRPIAWVNPRYEWLSVDGFVHPPTGETSWLTMAGVNVEALEAALAAFADDGGIDATHRVVLVVDRAGWHTSKRRALPEGLTLWFLPAYTPQLNPAERLWPLVREAVANRPVSTLDALEVVVGERCVTLSDAPLPIHALTNYHGWPWC
jgi:DDE superfamily endonuclease